MLYSCVYNLIALIGRKASFTHSLYVNYTLVGILWLWRDNFDFFGNESVFIDIESFGVLTNKVIKIEAYFNGL